MSVIKASLMAMVAMASVIAMALPLIFAVKGRAAWETIPPDVYARERMTIFRLRPLALWGVLGIVGLVGRACEWLHWQTGGDVVEGMMAGMLGLLLTAHLIWSFRLLRRGASVDKRLRLFARYTMAGAAAGLLVLAVGTLAWRVTA
jgi:hypothetical protein